MLFPLEKRYIEDFELFIYSCKSIISDYLGIDIAFTYDKDSLTSGHVEIDFEVSGEIDYPKFDQLIKRISANMIKLLKKHTISENELDWDMFNNLKLKLSLLFIFGDNENTKLNLRRVKFLNDLINISSRTYESTPANVGIVYCEKEQTNELEDKYNVDVIYLSSETEIKDFFESEKPFLRLVDGESINLLVNKQFRVYGMIRSKNTELNLSKEIIKRFENHRLDKNFIAVGQTYKDFYIGYEDTIIKKMKDTEGLDWEIFNKAVQGYKDFLTQSADRFVYNFSKPNFTYFRAEDGILNVYNEEDFIVAFENGEWKIKNFHFLQYILMFFSVLTIHPIMILETEEARHDILMSFLERVGVLMDTIISLSKNNISSIIVFVESEKSMLNLSSLTEQKASELLKDSPFKEKNSKKIYLELIKHDGVHLNLSDINTKLLESLCSVDGALVLDSNFNIVSFGEIINTSLQENLDNNTYGTGTNACKIASKNSLAIKISEDGDIKVYFKGIDILKI